MYPVGSAMTISWATSFKTFDIYLVFGQDFESPWQLKSECAGRKPSLLHCADCLAFPGGGHEYSFQWIVDDMGNNTLPFSILAVDPQKSKAEQTWVGFVSGQFWIADDSKDGKASQNAKSDSEATQNIDAADEDLTTSSRVQQTLTRTLTSTVDNPTAASETASSSATRPSLPDVTTAETESTQNTTTTQSSSSSIPPPAERTIYVAQPSPTPPQASDANATESASFLERHNLSTPGSSANIAAIGLGAGFGAAVLVVISVMAMWLLHRHRRSGRKEAGSDAENAKLEREGAREGVEGRRG